MSPPGFLWFFVSVDQVGRNPIAPLGKFLFLRLTTGNGLIPNAYRGTSFDGLW